jgi:hypothetical protein
MKLNVVLCTTLPTGTPLIVGAVFPGPGPGPGPGLLDSELLPPPQPDKARMTRTGGSRLRRQVRPLMTLLNTINIPE